MQGYLNYLAVPGNLLSLNMFRRESARNWLPLLRAEASGIVSRENGSGRSSNAWFPRVQVLHEHPNDRFYAKHPKSEPYAAILHVRFCTGGRPQGRSLP